MVNLKKNKLVADISAVEVESMLLEVFGDLPFIWEEAFNKPEVIVVQLLGGSSLPPYNFKINSDGNIYFV